jgi:hypothetical protein
LSCEAVQLSLQPGQVLVQGGVGELIQVFGGQRLEVDQPILAPIRWVVR